MKTRRKKKEWLLILPAIALGAALIAVFIFVEKKTSYTFEQEAYQSYSGAEAVIPQGTVLMPDGKGGIKTEWEKGVVEIDRELPVYFREEQKLVTVETMLCCQPHGGEDGRVDIFSEIYINQSGTVKLKYEKKERALLGGFLYDGKDTYILLEKMTLDFNRRTYELPALSYIQAVYGGRVSIYNYGTKEFISETVKEDPVMRAGEDYSVDLLYDMITDHVGKQTLLFTKPELLAPMRGIG